ncbi:MAG: hypothetical protein KGI58_01510 [Patescibacteria group bacterium]|nr:hypothetical protein [Patescibacteria group bacterium]
MITPELVQFVRSELARGATKELITAQLKTQAWTDVDINEVFKSVSSSTSSASSPYPKKSKVFLGFVLIVLFFIIIILGGFIAYASGYVIPLTNVFSESVQSSKSSTGTTFDIAVTVDSSGMKSLKNSEGFMSGTSNISTLDAKGSYDILDPKNIKGNLSLLLESGTFETGIDARSVDGSLYLDLTKAPDFGFISLKPFENKWVVVPYKSNPSELTNNPLLSASGISNIDNSPLSKLTDEQKQHIADITQKANFIKITSRHLPVIIDGNLSYHFNFDIDFNGIASYITDITNYLKSIDTNNTNISSIDTTEYSKWANAIKNFKGEAWIGVFNHLPYKIISNFDILNPDKPEDGTININTSIAYSNWNKPVVVEVPQGAITFDQLMSSVNSNPYNISSSTNDNSNSFIDAQNKSRDASMESIISNMRAQAELFYNANNTYKGFCTSRSQNGAYTLAVTLPQNTVYKCNDSSNEWASWAKLSTNSYWCADSTGFSGSGNIEKSSDTKCPFLYPTGLISATPAELKNIESANSIPDSSLPCIPGPGISC